MKSFPRVMKESNIQGLPRTFSVPRDFFVKENFHTLVIFRTNLLEKALGGGTTGKKFAFFFSETMFCLKIGKTKYFGTIKYNSFTRSILKMALF